jgi:glycosyltransferase involved in cell wall biosynthesis
MSKNERRFSIIMTVYDQAGELEENLPAFLQQEYEPGYEVIVVDESSTDRSGDVLKLLRNNYPHLYSTFLPKPNRLVSRRKLAFHLGVKASKYEWIIFTKVERKPEATDILKAISDNIDDDAELTLGYSVKKGIRLQPFSTCHEASSHIKRIERKLSKVRERKRMNYVWGRYDFIVMRKDVVYDVLDLFEQKLSLAKMLGIRTSIFMKNLFGRSSTTQLVTD